MSENGCVARVGSLARAGELLDGAALLVEESLCLNLRARQVLCVRCVDACDFAALAPSVDEIELDESACTGCGACVPACPAAALALSGFRPERLLEAIRGQERAAIHCRESRDEGGGVVVRCLRVLDARLLAAAAGGGTRQVELHGLERCGQCRCGSAGEAVDAWRSTLADWLGGAAPALAKAEAPGRAAPRRRLDRPHVSRRGFLRLAGRQGAAGAVRWLLPVAPEELEQLEESMPFFQGDVSGQLANPYQQALARRARDLPWREGAPLPFWQRAPTRDCSGCLACGQRCPTGALQAEERPDAKLLLAVPALCTDCGLCEAVCPFDALEISRPGVPPAPPGAPAVVGHWALRACRHCGLPWPADAAAEGLCPGCRNEGEMDDQWLSILNG